MLGNAIADAYAAAGAERCFAAEGSVMQDMARRTFAAELTAAVKKVPAAGLLGATAAPRALRPGEGNDFGIIDDGDPKIKGPVSAL